MTLNSNALTSVERLAIFLGISTPTAGSADENRLMLYINSLSNIIAGYTGKTFRETVFTREEYVTENGQTINLKHYPIITAETFILERRDSQLNEDDWEVVGSSYYTVESATGIIRAMGSYNFFRGSFVYRVTYTAGYDFDNSTTFLGDTSAGDVELALFLMAQDLDNSSGSLGNVKSERIGDYQVTYGAANWNGMGINNPQALAILNNYVELQGMGELTPLQGI